MVSVPLPLTTSTGKHPHEYTGRLINCHAIPLGQGGRDAAKRVRVPGLAAWGTTERTGCRGMLQVGGTLYSAWGSRLVRHSASAGAATDIAALNGTAKVFMWQDAAATPNVFAVDPSEGAFVLTTSSVTAYSSVDTDLPAVNSGCFFSGYSVFSTGGGRLYASDLNSTAINSLSYTACHSSPDGLLRVIPWGGRLYAFGSATCEVYTDVGSTPFPLARDVVIPRGLFGRYAIAGHEEGFKRALIWVGDDGAVYKMDGYTPTRVSPTDLDALIAAVADKDTLEACCYVSEGHGFWQLSSPAWTWVLDVGTMTWHERQSYGLTRSRITVAYKAFDKWLCGDTESGNIREITTAAKTEIGSPLRMRIETAPATTFPGRARVVRTDFEVTTGVGVAAGADPIETDPVMEISWSDDGGFYWSTPLIRKLGRQSIGDVAVTVRNTGITSTKGRIWRLDISDPVDVAVMACDMSVELRR